MRFVIPSAPQAGAPLPGATGSGVPLTIPSLPIAQAYETGLTLAAMGQTEAAITVLREFTARREAHAAAWRSLAALLRLAGQEQEAEAASRQAAGAPADPALWRRAPDTRTGEAFARAEARLDDMVGIGDRAPRLRQLLRANPCAVAAMRLLAAEERDAGEARIALALLERAMDLAPGYAACRQDLGLLMMARRDHPGALAQARILVDERPDDPIARALHADALRAVGDLPAALTAIEVLIQSGQRSPATRCAYAQGLHFAGRSGEAAGVYRACLAEAPATGEAYWGLAELKSGALTAADAAAMRAQLALPDLPPTDRMMMQYALGNCLERAGAYADSFAAYAEGAAVFRQAAEEGADSWDAAADAALLAHYRAVFTPDLLGAPAPATQAGAPVPIFIVGMPRAGSTLLEQILASHGEVEATLELPVLPFVMREFCELRGLDLDDAYPECIATLPPAARAGLGARYLALTAGYRRTRRPFFVDKRPANWREIGLIASILPQARIIDIRREPMAACFAMFKQILPADCGYSYDLQSLGDHFRGYAAMMEHWQLVLPDRVHRIAYEDLVASADTTIRAMLAYCGLPFEASCLRFWENERGVATPSAAQVRRPLYADSVSQWRHYAEWLTPLATALDGQGLLG